MQTECTVHLHHLVVCFLTVRTGLDCTVCTVLYHFFFYFVPRCDCCCSGNVRKFSRRKNASWFCGHSTNDTTPPHWLPSPPWNMSTCSRGPGELCSCISFGEPMTKRIFTVIPLAAGYFSGHKRSSRGLSRPTEESILVADTQIKYFDINHRVDCNPTLSS